MKSADSLMSTNPTECLTVHFEVFASMLNPPNEFSMSLRLFASLLMFVSNLYLSSSWIIIFLEPLVLSMIYASSFSISDPYMKLFLDAFITSTEILTKMSSLRFVFTDSRISYSALTIGSQRSGLSTPR